MRWRSAGLVAGLVVGYGLRRWMTRPLPPLVRVAHRGGAATAPENTLAAYRQAQAAGLRHWELDVQLTADGALVVFHDEILDRTTDGAGPLAGRTLADLKTLDAGAWFGAQWRGERIPTLAEVIALGRQTPGGPARLLVEIKSPHLYPGIEAAVLDVLASEAYHKHVIIMSFDTESLVRVRALAPDLPLCHLMGAESLLLPPPAAAAEVLGPIWQLVAFNPLAIAAAHRAQRQVFTWTVNSPLAARWLRLCGVDGLISDRIDLLLSI